MVSLTSHISITKDGDEWVAKEESGVSCKAKTVQKVLEKLRRNVETRDEALR